MNIGTHYMSDREYFGLDLPSASTTKVLLSGTNAALAAERERVQEHSKAFAIGAMAHAVVLTPDIIASEFVVIPDGIDRRTKDGKAAYADLEARAERNRARLISESDAANARRIGESVLQSAVWQDIDRWIEHREVVVIGEIGGRKVKAKIDAADDGFTIIVDIKTAASAERSAFQRAITMYNYAHQAAFYMETLRSVGRNPTDFVFVVAEKDAPYGVAAYRLDNRAIRSAAARLPELVERWYAVVEGGDRTGYPQTIQPIDLPEWAYNSKGEPNDE